jgi:thiol-disulfide isomerase/thioredoxin
MSGLYVTTFNGHYDRINIDHGDRRKCLLTRFGLKMPYRHHLMFFFFSFISPIAIQLTSENFTSFIAESKKPLFLKLWATWCPHCREFAPTWDDLSNSSEISDDVYIADIECESNRATCKAYPGGTNYPRLYWVDLENRTAVPYTGPRTLDHFVSFIKKQLRFPMVLVNDSEVRNEVASANVSTVFLFRIPETDTEGVAVAREVTLAFRTFECRFLIQMDSISDRSMTAFTGYNRSAVYEGEWSTGSISEFVLRKSVPFLANLSSYVMRHAKDNKLTLFIVITAGLGGVPDVAVRVADRAAEEFPVAVTNCVESAYFCRYLGIGTPLRNTVHVIYNRSQRVFWVNDLAEEDAVAEWVLAVKNGSIRAHGPGPGLLGDFLEVYYDNRGHGRPVILIAIGPIIALVSVAFLMADCRSAVKRD